MAAIQIREHFTFLLSVPICVLAIFVIVFILVGAIYAGGGMSKQTYVTMMVVAVTLFVFCLAVAGGLFFYVRYTRPV